MFSLLYITLLSNVMFHLGFVHISPEYAKPLTMTKAQFLKKEADFSLTKNQEDKKKKRLKRKRKHSMWKALILAFPWPFLPSGILGFHTFYLGYKRRTWIKLGMTWGILSFLLIALYIKIPFFLTIAFWTPILVSLIVEAMIDFALISIGELKFKDGTPLEW